MRMSLEWNVSKSMFMAKCVCLAQRERERSQKFIYDQSVSIPLHLMNEIVANKFYGLLDSL